MKSTTLPKSILYPLLILMLAQFACSLGAKVPSAAPDQPGSSNPAPASASGDQIVVSGTISKTYPPVNVSIGQFGPSQIRLYMNEATPKDLSRVGDALTIDFPADSQVGDHPFENFIENSSATLWSTYGVSDTSGTFFFKSINGTLTLTAVGNTYSGKFQFTAADATDPSKTIEVTGSFTSLPFNQ